MVIPVKPYNGLPVFHFDPARNVQGFDQVPFGFKVHFTVQERAEFVCQIFQRPYIRVVNLQAGQFRPLIVPQFVKFRKLRFKIGKLGFQQRHWQGRGTGQIQIQRPALFAFKPFNCLFGQPKRFFNFARMLPGFGLRLFQCNADMDGIRHDFLDPVPNGVIDFNNRQ